MERTYTISLRKETAKAPTKKKAKKAVRAIREYVAKHMKVETVGLGGELNELIWARGIENPPGKVTVQVKKDGDSAFVNLVGKSLEPTKVVMETTEEQKNMLQQQVEKLKDLGKKETPSEEPMPEEKPAEAKEEKPKVAKKATKKAAPKAKPETKDAPKE